MTDVFTRAETVSRFVSNVDLAIQRGTYTRGDLFRKLILKTVPTGSQILDYGCGPGRIAHMLAQSGYTVRAMDPSAEMIAHANRLDRTNLDLRFEVGCETALNANTWDAIVCSSVIDYVKDAADLLARFWYSLRDSGILVISHGNRLSYWDWRWKRDQRAYNPFLPALQHHWTAGEFRKFLRRNSFEAISPPRFIEPDAVVRLGRLGLGGRFVGAVSIVAARKAVRR